MKPQRAWALCDKRGRINIDYIFSGPNIARDYCKSIIDEDERIVRVKITIEEKGMKK